MWCSLTRARLPYIIVATSQMDRRHPENNEIRLLGSVLYCVSWCITVSPLKTLFFPMVSMKKNQCSTSLCWIRHVPHLHAKHASYYLHLITFNADSTPQSKGHWKWTKIFRKWHPHLQAAPETHKNPQLFWRNVLFWGIDNGKKHPWKLG